MDAHVITVTISEVEGGFEVRMEAKVGNEETKCSVIANALLEAFQRDAERLKDAMAAAAAKRSGASLH